MIDFSKPHEAIWHVFRVNPDTWENMDELGGLVNGSINRDGSDSVPLLESGSFTFDTEVRSRFEEGYYRIEGVFVQNGERDNEVISTMLFQSSSGTINRGNDEKTVDAFSVLYPAQERKKGESGYVPKGCDGPEYIQDLFAECEIKAPVILETENGTFTVDRYVVFDIGETYISIAWKILDAANWIMYIDEHGRVHVAPKRTEYDLVLDRVNAKYVMPGSSYTYSLRDVPNRYYAYYGSEKAVAENHGNVDEEGEVDSETSYMARGRWIDYYDTNPIQINGETLQAYAERKLQEMSTLMDTHTYTREYQPGVYPFSLIGGALSDIDLMGDMRVISQSLSLNYGIIVSETVGIEIVTWEAP